MKKPLGKRLIAALEELNDALQTGKPVEQSEIRIVKGKHGDIVSRVRFRGSIRKGK